MRRQGRSEPGGRTGPLGASSRLVLGRTVVVQLATDALLDEIHHLAATCERPVLIVSGNARGIVLAERDPVMREAYDRADLVRVDGASLAFAARLQRTQPVVRSTWADFVWDLAASMEEAGLSLFLLGGRSEAVEATARLISERHPRLQLVGVRDGSFDHSPGSRDSLELVALLRAAEPDVVVVGLGMPLQERWLIAHLDDLPPAVYMTAGAVFDYASGAVRRPPAWMCRHGLEWLGRILIEPRRLLLRYAVELPRFVSLATRSAWEARAAPIERSTQG
jgi:N-acetylglucosaminyldiphosphoundecaprenol N-acetyl-beta-D-mannosaminyltransferase